MERSTERTMFSNDSATRNGDIMLNNVGIIDRAVRIVIGLLLIAYAIPLGFPSTGWNWVGWIGIVPIITALVGTCPAYSVLGVSTCAVGVHKT